MSARGEFRVAAVQATPAYLDREATLDIAAQHIAAAGADGANLVAFPESFVPGYPDWVWRMTAAQDGAWYHRFQDQAVEIDGGQAALEVGEKEGASSFSPCRFHIS